MGGLTAAAKAKGYAVMGKLKSRALFAALICVALGAMAGRASAVTVEVAKKCEALAAKAFPPREVGNPAAGSAQGSARDEQIYYAKCIANGGHTEGQAPHAEGQGSKPAK